MFLAFLLKTTSKNHTQIIKGVLHENAGRFYVEYIPKTVYNERKIHRRLQIMRDHRNQSKKRKKICTNDYMFACDISSCRSSIDSSCDG